MRLRERVFVVKRDDLFDGIGEFSGFRADYQYIRRVLTNIENSAFFAPRSTVEEDPSLKQIIPYCPVCCGDSVLLLKRKRTQDEKRLHNLYSLGIGGHINPEDSGVGGFYSFVERALMRELNEELLLLCSPSIKFIGVLNDESNPVGSVHFGLIHSVTVPDRNSVRIRETALMEGGFVAVSELIGYASGMESWSQILLERINSWLL